LFLLYLCWFFILVQVWLGILSLRGGSRFRRYVRAELVRPKNDFKPFASVIAPCRGVEQGLRENLAGLFRLDYPEYEILFVIDDAADPAGRVIDDLRKQARIPSKLIVAGGATNNGQKVHNLIAALNEVDQRSQVLVFVDSDARPSQGWLSALVEPLADEQVGAATGYRWFVPVRGGLASHLRSVWNASTASALGSDHKGNFCWGGSTAIRRSTFETAGVVRYWKHAASDDFAMMHALRSANMPIHFVPLCLTPSFEDCGFRELLEFTNRQLKITRVYAPPFWKAVLFGSILFVSVFFGLIVSIGVRLIFADSVIAQVLALALIFCLGSAKSFLRAACVDEVFSRQGLKVNSGRIAHLLMWPVGSLLFLFNSLAALFSRTIEWRGIRYELKSPDETVIIRRSNPR
jgi:ceramide glucosyltransferase